MADPRRFEKIVQVNGLDYHRYHDVRHALLAGESVELERDPNNSHDRRAVKVNFAGVQVGWVPKACNEEIAQRMDAGENLTARVVDHRHGRLLIEVLGEINKPIAPLGLRWDDTHPVDNGAQAYREFESAPAGSSFSLRTNSHRTSVDIVEDGGRRMGWFRKSIFPVDVHWSDFGARLVVGGPLKIYLDGVTPPDSKPYQRPVKVIPAAAAVAEEINRSTHNPQKETTMTTAIVINKIIATNKAAATDAAVLEAGRIANNTIVKLVKPHTPLMLKGVIATPLGKLLVANLAVVAAQQLRPDDATVKALTEAMATAAFQEIYQTVDLEGMFESLMDNPEVKRAVRKLDSKKAPAAAKAEE